MVFVDATSGAEAQFGPYKLVACFKSVGGANIDPLGNKFMSITLAIDKLGCAEGGGQLLWRSLWTPFAPDDDVVDAEHRPPRSRRSRSEARRAAS